MILNFIKKFILPKSHNKDKARQEFILNILLTGTLLITFFAFFVVLLADYYHLSVQGGIPPYIILFFFFFLMVLFRLSRAGKVKLSAILLMSFFYIPVTYTLFKWGIGVVEAWLIYALLIVMSGVVIGTRFAFFLTLSIVITGSIVSFFQVSGMYPPDLSWEKTSYTFGDSMLLNVTLIVIAVIAWLSNREIEKLLKRAHESELALKKERDMLEIKVEERTKDLKKAQLEKMTQLYRFAEVGRLSSGLFHDLVTPLSLISLHLERLKIKGEQGDIDSVETQMKKAIKATRYLETFVKAVRKQLQNQGSDKVFSVNKEIKLIIQMLRHKSGSLGVRITFHATEEIQIFGDEVKFSQLMINLVLNAIDAYEDVDAREKEREIQINLSHNENGVILTIRDEGIGIPPENLKKIFQPFFTTKKVEKGTGIGLSISQEIVEKHFRGKIYVRSNRNVETIFTIVFPLHTKRKEKNEEIALVTSHQ